VPLGNESALCDAIQVLASDVGLRERLGRNARMRVEREFDREMVLKQLLDFYRNELL